MSLYIMGPTSVAQDKFIRALKGMNGKLMKE